MMGFLLTLGSAPADHVMFVDGERQITAGEIRAAAIRAAARAPAGDPIFLHTDSAAMMCAGLLAGAMLRRRIAMLPHVQPAYLEEIGATSLWSDTGPNAVLTPGGSDNSTLYAGTDSGLVFFTSGSTGAPKQVPKRMSELDAEVHHWARTFTGINHVAGTVSHQHIYGMTFRVILAVVAGWRAQDRQAFTWESFSVGMSPQGLAVTSPAHLSRIPPELPLPNGLPGLILSAGQLLPLAAAQETASRFGKPALEILGSTETGAIATRQRTDDAEPWTPVSGVDVWADDEGVLSIRSSFLAGGNERMGDLIERMPDGRFHLRGRADRVVKIDGKRISLARVEEALRALPGVADAAAVGLPSDAGEVLGAAVVLKPEGGHELAKLGAFRFGRKLRNDLADRLEMGERPKRWRFVGRIPENTQGKRAAAEIAGLFETGSLLLELDAKVEVTGDEARISFTLDAGLRFFEGHFPGRPVLAGVAQTHLATRLGEEIWGFLPGSFQVNRMKFRKLIQPGEQVLLVLTRDIAKARLAFNFSADGEAGSEGVIGP